MMSVFLYILRYLAVLWRWSAMIGCPLTTWVFAGARNGGKGIGPCPGSAYSYTWNILF